MTDEAFEGIDVENWRQFASVSVDLRAKLTILTGENGTGKSTLLTILADQFDQQQFSYIGSPSRPGSELHAWEQLHHPSNALFARPTRNVARISYTSGRHSFASADSGDQPEFTLAYKPQLGVPGIFLDSHRSSGGYQRVEKIPARFSSTEELAREYSNRVRGQQQSVLGTRPPSQALKESLLAAALYAEGNKFVKSDDLASTVWNGFQGVLRQLFPPSLEFQNLVVESGEVLIETARSAFPMEAASGGLSAIIDLSWQIFLAARNHSVFTVCFDEPENHLHPSLQRSLLPNLLAAFPHVKFVVATHSPFVVSSVRQARVYALRKGAGEGVVSQWLDFQDQAYPAEEILRNVLGVDSTLPLWAEADLNRIIKRFEGEPFTARSAQAMRESFREA